MQLDLASPQLASLQENDEDAWRAAYELLWQDCWKVARAILRWADPTLVEEVTVKAIGQIAEGIVSGKAGSFQRLANFDDVRNMSVSVTRRRAIDAVRSASRRRTPVSLDQEEFPELPEPSDPHRRRILADHLLAAVAELAPPIDDILVDRFFLGLTTREISEKRTIPYGSVCTYMARGLRELRETLTDR